MLTRSQVTDLDHRLQDFVSEYAQQEGSTAFEILQVIHVMHRNIPLEGMSECIQCKAIGTEPICGDCGVVRE